MTAVSGKKNGQDFSGSYTYDKAGNPTSYFNPGDLSTWTLGWKNGRELGKAVKSGTTLSFDYDVNGLRTWKQVDGVRHNYTYASGLLLRESYSQNGTDYTLDFLYDLNNRPYMLYLTTKTGSATTSKPYYYILNLQGDVVHLVNTSGKAVASYRYDPYGAVISKSGELADLNPIRYRGYYYDTETGFYYLHSRYYDPILGRFINADRYISTGQGYLGYNAFSYCGNNPVNRADYSGELWWIPGAIGAGIGFVSTLVTGGDLGDACISAAEGFVCAYIPDEAIHVCNGVVTAADTWVRGGSFWEGVVKGSVSYLVSYVSGSSILGSNATNGENAAVDLTFGLGARMCGDAVTTAAFRSSGKANHESSQSASRMTTRLPGNTQPTYKNPYTVSDVYELRHLKGGKRNGRSTSNRFRTDRSGYGWSSPS